MRRTTFLKPFFAFSPDAKPISRFWWIVFLPSSLGLWVVTVAANLVARNAWFGQALYSSNSGWRAGVATILALVNFAMYVAAYVGLALLWLRLQMTTTRYGIGALSWWIFGALVLFSLGSDWEPMSQVDSLTIRPLYFTILAFLIIGFQGVQCFTWAWFVRSHIELRNMPLS
ncbi:MAG: hypothetical protein ACYDEH_09595 [Acidimicrobiales bacterium]